MTMFVVDTNVLVYAAALDSPWHAPCAAAVERWRRDPGAWFITWSIAYEFVRVATHRNVMRTRWTARDAWRYIESLLASPGLAVLVPTDRHPAVAAKVLEEVPAIEGNFVHDANIAILMREHGIRRIYTRDLAFHRFPFLDPVDPALPAFPPGTAEPVARYRAKSRRAVRARART
jgi:toxin-antitoxin system PIN domain toxin